MTDQPLSSSRAAPQHGPRPLPLFLELLRSETEGNPNRRTAALKGLRAYQDADRGPPRTLAPAIATAGRAQLRDYGGAGRPVVFIPSLINPPFVLDLPGNSLIAWVRDRGFRPLLVDWGTPTPENAAQDVTRHVEELLLPLLSALDVPPVLVGYCLGGTMALAAACAMPVAGLSLIAAPWRFGGYEADAQTQIDDLWHTAHPLCETLGLVPMEVLQVGFWRLDPQRTIAKFEAFADVPRDSAKARSFAALEDWANGGAPLTYAAGRQLFDDFFHADLPGTGRWRVGGVTTDPTQLSCPTLEFVSHSDRIVPAATSALLGDRRTLPWGHVGMVVGSRARAGLWEPLTDWLEHLA